MRYCGKCGNQLEDGNIYCPKCGNSTQNSNNNSQQPQVVYLKESNNKTSVGSAIGSFFAAVGILVLIVFAIYKAANNVGPVIDNSRKSSMRVTAQMIIEAVQTQLTTNFELYPGTYGFSENSISNVGSAPFGGQYAYYTKGKSSDKIGNGIYRINNKITDVYSDCSESEYSYVVIARDEETSNYKYYICLTTTNRGNDGGYIAGSRDQIDDPYNSDIFHGKAAK